MATSSPAAPSPAPVRQRGVARLAAVAALLGGVGLLSTTALERSSTLRRQWPDEVDELYLPPSSALRRISLGHTELFADLIAARANVYFGDQLSSKGAQKWLEFYLNTVVDLDPHFEPIYLRGAAMLVYSGRAVNLEGVDAANRLLQRGVAAYPQNWEMWFQLGFNLAFEMPGLVSKDDPRIPDWKRQGTEYLRKSTFFEGIPSHLPNVVANMLSEQGERELAIQHLERVFAATSDSSVRTQIRRKIAQLMGDNYVASFEQEVRRLAGMLARRYPYAPEAFSLIAGPRRKPVLDLEALAPEIGEQP